MIYIVRHGQTAGNRTNVLQGRGSDHPLNETGVSQAQNLHTYFEKRGIRFDRIYTSPLRRAVQTARIIAGENAPGEPAGENAAGEREPAGEKTGPEERTAGSPEIITDERLLEMDYGPYEGMNLEHLSPEVMTFFSDFVRNPAPEGM